MSDRVQLDETPQQTIERLQATIEQMQVAAIENLAQLQSNYEAAQQEIIRMREIAARIPALEQAAAERNNLAMQINDITQERDRLKQLLLGIVPSLDQFSVDYPQATVSRTAFDGESPQEIAEKMALWDAVRAQKISDWEALRNYVRTQATV